MTTAVAASIPHQITPSLGDLRAEYAPVFEAIRSGAVQRERGRDLPFLVVEQLKESGFTALRIPAEFGGRGVGLADYIELLTDLAAADSNVAHLLRGHVAFVERLLLGAPDAHRDGWLRRIGAGALIGNANSERQELNEVTTRLEERGGRPVVSGTKYYTTGSLYADWVSLTAVRAGIRHSVLVNAHHPGVQITDDWDGFGQQLTASGSLVLEDVPVDPADVQPFDQADPFTGFGVAVFQTVLLAVAAGIAQAALDDAVAFVRPRRRTFANPGELVPREQEIVQTVVGELAGKVHAARLIVAGQARELERFASRAAGTTAAIGTKEEADRLALDVFKSQQVVLKLALDTATELFEVGGASATSTASRLDRHWRNARTVASHNPAKYRARAVGDHLLNGRVQLWGSRPDGAGSTRPTP
ncbi:acyl-CoA dehydrogenase family protein [Arthrobacter ginkgonis]|uniref:Acyl-CoA dehydrogenase family protein n=1 Tax=Arthrobacter ginkgonis TaxID=1630594 RepID=A0ABP7BTJ5_9MICC